MLKSIIRWGLFSGALFVAGPIAWLATGPLRGIDGGHETTPLLSTTPIPGIALAVGAVLLAGAIGAISARLVGLHAALFNAGMVLAWAAFGTGTVDALARTAGGSAVGWTLAVEGLILALPAMGAAWVISRVALASGHWHVPIHQHDEPGFSPMTGAAIAAGAAIVVGFVAPWMVAQNTLKMQTIAAGAIAGMFGAAVAMAIHHRAHPAAILAGACCMAALGPAAGMVMHGGGVETGFGAMALAGKLAPAARVLPLDWIAGAFLGTPIGLSLGAWVTESRHHRAMPAPA